jgi:endonuclease/exonuclease/phosphatase family metal-dependent hydrolase
MKLVTYNLHLGGRRGGGSHWDLLDREYAPDIIFAQEATRVKGLIEGQREAMWRRVNGRDWGSAVVVRGRIVEELNVPVHAGWISGCVAEVENFGTVSAISIHAPTLAGKKYPALVKDIVTAISGMRLDAPLVIGGDLNLISAGVRQPDELIPTTALELSILQQLQEDLGLISCWGAANPAAPLPQTLRWSRDIEIPYHCDVLLVPETWEIVSCEIPQGEPWTRMSDHSPVVADVVPGVLARSTAPGIGSQSRSDVA